MNTELLSATELVALIRDRKLGSLELLDAQLARIDEHNEGINAVVAMDVEGAREAARAADDAPPDRRGPLHGLPITIKDSWEVAGMPATCGFPELADHVPDARRGAGGPAAGAGAIPFGKTNVPFAAADHQSYNPVYGTTNNPWDLRGRRADRRAGRPQRSPPGSRRWSSAATSRARSASRRISVASSDTSPASGSSRAVGTSLRPRAA